LKSDLLTHVHTHTSTTAIITVYYITTQTHINTTNIKEHLQVHLY
jgi:hypothetical protein